MRKRSCAEALAGGDSSAVSSLCHLAFAVRKSLVSVIRNCQILSRSSQWWWPTSEQANVRSDNDTFVSLVAGDSAVPSGRAVVCMIARTAMIATIATIAGFYETRNSFETSIASKPKCCVCMCTRFPGRCRAPVRCAAMRCDATMATMSRMPSFAALVSRPRRPHRLHPFSSPPLFPPPSSQCGAARSLICRGQLVT